MDPASRPPFLVATADVPERSHVYPDSDEPRAPARPIGRAAGLRRIGLHLHRVGPGQRTSFPHAESHEEEFAFVVDGELDAWIDGVLHPVKAGDLVAFPAGTGVCHCLINNGTREATLLAGGDAGNPANRIYYPRNPERQAQIPPGEWWSDIPLGPQGDHDGRPHALRARQG